MEWIKINNDLPELDALVMLFQENIRYKEGCKKGWVEMGFLNSKKETSSGFYYEFMDSKHNEIFNITHWQPLPEPPKK